MGLIIVGIMLALVLVVAVGTWRLRREQAALRHAVLAAGLAYAETMTREAGLELIRGTGLLLYDWGHHRFCDLLQGSRRGLVVTVVRHTLGDGKLAVSETVFCIAAGERGLDLRAPAQPPTGDLQDFCQDMVDGRVLIYKPGFVVHSAELLHWLDRVLDVVEPWALSPAGN